MSCIHGPSNLSNASTSKTENNIAGLEIQISKCMILGNRSINIFTCCFHISNGLDRCRARFFREKGQFPKIATFCRFVYLMKTSVNKFQNLFKWLQMLYFHTSFSTPFPSTFMIRTVPSSTKYMPS